MFAKVTLEVSCDFVSFDSICLLFTVFGLLHLTVHDVIISDSLVENSLCMWLVITSSSHGWRLCHASMPSVACCMPRCIVVSVCFNTALSKHMIRTVCRIVSRFSNSYLDSCQTELETQFTCSIFCSSIAILSVIAVILANCFTILVWCLLSAFCFWRLTRMVTIVCRRRNCRAGCDIFNANLWTRRLISSGLTYHGRILICSRGMNIYNILIRMIKVFLFVFIYLCLFLQLAK